MFDAVLERCRLELRARVAPRLLELGEDVLHRRHAELLVGEFLGAQRAQHGALADELVHADAGLRHDALHDRVGFGMHGRRVERVGAVHDAEEAGRLLERAIADTRHLQDVAPIAKRTVLVAEGDDVLGDGVGEAGDARQQRHRRRVDVGADRVDTIFHNGVELARELQLADVMLILPHTDRLRIDAHQFRQRILEAARDRHRAAQRHIEVGEFLRRQL